MRARPTLPPSRTTALLAVVIAVATVAACGASTNPGRRIFDGGTEEGDGSVEPGADLAVYLGPCDDQHPCKKGERCYKGQCIRDNGTCTGDGQCQNDSYCDCTMGGGGDMGACMGGVCVPYGLGPRGPLDPTCTTGEAFSAKDFEQPVVKCSWTNEDVIVTPVLVDLDLDNKPEIVFVTYPAGNMVAIRGNNCQVVWTKNAGLNNLAQLAAADLDGDKIPEIIGTDNSRRLVIFDRDGNKIATSPSGYQGAGTGSDCAGASIVDVDGQAPPEIAIGGMVARYVKGQGITVLFNHAVTPAQWGTMTAMADLDGDGAPELVSGLQVYDGKTGQAKTPAAWGQLGGSPGAYPAVADFNGDKKPDVLLVQSRSGAEKVSVWDWAGQKFIFGPMNVTGGWGGPPTIADFDGDGVPDFGAAGPNNYYVFAMKCWPGGGGGCAQPGILWIKKTKDTSSGGTGSSVFDFNGDGKAEVIYRDECFFRAYDGTTGKTLMAMQMTSGTCLENPIVGDVDNDGHADVVVPSDNVQGNGCAGQVDADTGLQWKTNTQGLFVLSDPMNRWMPSRPIWNQHTYHITNVNDDATIPASEMPNWASWNNYRQNVQGKAPGMITPGPDFTGGEQMPLDQPGDCKSLQRLWAQICNRGTAAVGPGVRGTFYTSDPRQAGAMKICSTQTTKGLNPGDCEAVFCDWMNPPGGTVDLWFRANDDGVKANLQNECTNDNDLLFLPNVACFIPG